ncbi:hypothetical protein LCGC14_2497900 [marine sediment metagenome]|uniref:Glutaredoxin domain-containing protein n=2 Tax=root TaxID=1 RepID=A0A0F9DEP1_9ZZZZ|nr:MAG: hypothetical protein LCMAC202_03690 [Marseillevirus LCMAC202]
MSVIKAILFYSKHDQKSFRMKKVIDGVGADIETISVDVLEVRERLQEDEKFGIDQVPAVLVLYSSGQHKTYITNSLDQWFDQLLQNIKQFQLQREEALQPQPTQVQYTPIDENIPKPLRIKPGSTSDIPSSLPSPGKAIQEGTTLIDAPTQSIMSGSTQVTGVGEISAAQAAMVSEHIREAEPLIPITSEPYVQSGRKEVKKEGLSAAELAKQMADQREVFEEKLEQNRPFM